MGDSENMTTRLNERFRVRSYEVDPMGRLQVPILCQLLQEVATTHAAEIGVAVDTLIESGVAWVLSRLDLHMERWPRIDDEIVVETWPAAMNRLRTERRFRILDSWVPRSALLHRDGLLRIARARIHGRPFPPQCSKQAEQVPPASSFAASG